MNLIGIENNKADQLNQALSELLSNYQIFYANVRGFHWNIRGNQFFQLHAKFEELYNDLNEKVDEIAERILTLGGKPEYRYSMYKNLSAIAEVEKTENGQENMQNILNSFSILVSKQRAIMELAQEANDEGTASQMSDYIREQEKMMWMYAAYLNK